jgi:arginase
VTGRGLPELADLDGLAPYVADRDVVALGEREHERRGADAYASEIEVVDLDALRSAGAASAGHDAAGRLAGQGVDGFWIHVDVDVLDSELMPAVDSPQPGGLEPGELAELLAVLSAHPLARGLEVTVYDPELDPDGACAERIVAVLADALS